MSLPLLLAAALAAPPTVPPAPLWAVALPDTEADAIRACPESFEDDAPQPFCAASDVAYQRVFLEGRVGAGAEVTVSGLLGALEAGERRVWLAPDRAAVDAELAATLRTVDALTAPGASFVQILVVAAGVEPLLDAYAALPGAAGPGVASALRPPPRTPAVLRETALGTCTVGVHSFVGEGPTGAFVPVWGEWSLLGGGRDGLGPPLVHRADFKARALDRCAAWNAVHFDGTSPPPTLHFAWFPHGEDALLHLLVDSIAADGMLLGVRDVLGSLDSQRVALLAEGRGEGASPSGLEGPGAGRWRSPRPVR